MNSKSYRLKSPQGRREKVGGGGGGGGKRCYTERNYEGMDKVEKMASFHSAGKQSER